MLSYVKLLLGRSLESRSCSSRTPQSGPPRSNAHCCARHQRPQPSHPQVLSSVAGDVSYCWGPAIQEIDVCGGEHSSACLLSEGPNMRRFGRCCGVRKLSPSSRFHMTASTKPFSMISSTDTAVNIRSITNANLSNTRRKMARFVLIIE